MKMTMKENEEIKIKPIEKTKPFNKEDTKKFIEYVKNNTPSEEDKQVLLSRAKLILKST